MKKINYFPVGLAIFVGGILQDPLRADSACVDKLTYCVGELQKAQAILQDKSCQQAAAAYDKNQYIEKEKALQAAVTQLKQDGDPQLARPLEAELQMMEKKQL